MSLADVDWSAENINSHPFRTCPACEGIVIQVSAAPLMKVCSGCEKAYEIVRPLRFRAGAHNTADAIAYLLHDAGLSWPSVGVVMRIYHNVELGPNGWRHRIKSQYRRAA